MESLSKKEEDELKKLKEKEIKDDISEEKPVIEEKKEIEEKEIGKLKEDKKKSLSFYERLFGETDETVLKKGSYIPPDKKMIQIAEEELTEYKEVREKLTDQIKRDKMKKDDEISSLKRDVSDRLKELEYIERSKEDKLSTEYRNLLRLKDELEKASQKKLDILQQREDLIEKKRRQDLDELNKLYEEYVERIQFHKNKDKYRYLLELINSYDGTSGSMMELKHRLQRLVEIDISEKRIRKRLSIRKEKQKRTRMKLRNPDRGVYSVKELLMN